MRDFTPEEKELIVNTPITMKKVKYIIFHVQLFVYRH